MALIGAALAAGQASAQREPATARGGSEFGACSEDARRLCGDIKPGQGRMFRCLHEKALELSPACREFEARHWAEFGGQRDACRNDVRRFCADVKPGQGRIAACLKDHRTEVSPACREEIASRQ